MAQIPPAKPPSLKCPPPRSRAVPHLQPRAGLCEEKQRNASKQAGRSPSWASSPPSPRADRAGQRLAERPCLPASLLARTWRFPQPRGEAAPRARLVAFPAGNVARGRGPQRGGGGGTEGGLSSLTPTPQPACAKLVKEKQTGKESQGGGRRAEVRVSPSGAAEELRRGTI